jgi:hypothetical protein
MEFELLELDSKTVLQIGSRRRETTRELSARMAGGGGRLIVTDINDEYFPTLQKDLEHVDLTIDFVRTSALKLAGVRPGSIDLLVCNYALCTINAIVGQGELALHKFYEVLKPGGMLYIEEELPFYMAASPAQRVWAEQWQLLKAAQLLSGNRPTNEYQPDVLEALVSAAGFEEVDLSDEVASIPTSDWWDPFQARFDNALETIKSDILRTALIESAQKLEENACATGNLEVPYVILTAKKPWRID